MPYSLVEFDHGRFCWKCLLCNLWVTKEHLESKGHKQKLLSLSNYPVEAGKLPAQAWTQQTPSRVGHQLALSSAQVQNPTITDLETTVARLGCRIGLMEEQVEVLSDAARKFGEDLKSNTERIAALETLVANAIGDKLEMFEKLDQAAKLIAELDKRTIAVEQRESWSSWSGGATVGRSGGAAAGRWQNFAELDKRTIAVEQRESWSSYSGGATAGIWQNWLATPEESRWAPSSSSTL